MSEKSERLVGRYKESFLLHRAAAIVKDKTKSSVLFDEEAESRIPKFSQGELTKGRVLGRGGYCTVSEISKVELTESIYNGENGGNMRAGDQDDDPVFIDGGFGAGDVIQDRKFISTRYLRNGKDARYAIKILSDDVVKDPERFIAGVIDLAIESRFLAVIKHPNIIKMRATADIDPYKHGFFVVLDRLYDTLTTRLAVWRKARGKVSGFARLCDCKGNKKKELFVERLLVGYDLAAALRYLHSLNVIYRDLKPDNIGFDVRGDVKIFDFGLAREVKPDERNQQELYKLSGNTGSIRYMAPEVSKGEPYNETVDAYSFGILLWQMCTLQTPYSGYTPNMHSELVVKKGARPKLDPSWTPNLTHLIQSCWSGHIPDRPNFEDIGNILRSEISMLRGDDEFIMDSSNRTMKSLQSGGGGGGGGGSN